MTVRILFFFAIVTFFVQGCKKDPPLYVIPSNASPYYPIGKGSVWKYVLEFPENLPDTSAHVLTGDSSFIKGKVYRTALSISKLYGTTYDYVHNSNHIIISRTTLTVLGSTVNMQILNDTLQVGGTWSIPTTDNGTIDGVPTRLNGIIIERDISKTVNGVAFPNVIHTRVDLQYDRGAGFTTETVYDFFIAKDVGLILTEAVTDGQLSTSRLIDYTINPEQLQLN